MYRRGLASAATFAILFGAIMLASRADAITLAAPSGLRAAAATRDLSQPVQYYCGWGAGYGGYGYGGYDGGGYGYGGYSYGGYPVYGYGSGGPYGYGGYSRPYYGYGGYSRPYYGYGGYPGWGYRVRWW